VLLLLRTLRILLTVHQAAVDGWEVRVGQLLRCVRRLLQRGWRHGLVEPWHGMRHLLRAEQVCAARPQPAWVLIAATKHVVGEGIQGLVLQPRNGGVRGHVVMVLLPPRHWEPISRQATRGQARQQHVSVMSTR
jgi:hypothetical protein